MEREWNRADTLLLINDYEALPFLWDVLINEYEALPFLWDVSSVIYRNKLKKADAWR